jgi:hypothetical protein
MKEYFHVHHIKLSWGSSVQQLGYGLGNQSIMDNFLQGATGFPCPQHPHMLWGLCTMY